MKLAIIARGLLEYDGSAYYVKEVFGKRMEELSSCFSEIIICAPVLPPKPRMQSICHYQISSPNVSYLNLTSFLSGKQNIWGKVRTQLRSARIIWKHINEWDMIYIFIPAYSGAITFFINKFFSKPYFVYSGGDWEEISRYTGQWSGLNKILYPVYQRLNKWLEKSIVSDAPLVLVHGKALERKYNLISKGVICQTVPEIAISNADIYYRDNTCTSNTAVRCLFVGGIIPSKGLQYLIKALPLIKSEVRLDIVGAPNPVQYQEELVELAESLQVVDKIEFKGYVPNGPDLIKIYRQSDIFVLPTSSEGFPRVLYEAMSQSLPIITTNVGGIPDLMKHEENAFCVPPKSPEALAKSIERLINDNELRRRLIKNGRETVATVLNLNAREQLDSLLKANFHQYRRWTRQVLPHF